jgi:prevent-host-death family protein
MCILYIGGIAMKTWLVKDARAHFGDVIAGALAGEPQRVARRGRETVIVQSEEDWRRGVRPAEADRSRKSLAQLVAEFPLTAEEWEAVRPPRLGLRSRRRAPES